MTDKGISKKPGTHSAFLGIGSALPERVLDNHYFETIVETSDEWIRERSGIVERRFAHPDELNSDLASRAGLKALEDAGIEASELDIVIVATCTQDRQIPANAMAVQEKMGAVNAAAFDVNAACTGFIYGVSIADAMIRCGQARYILVLGSELLSRCINMKDRTTCVLFGDGAGGVVMGPSDGYRGVISHYIRSDGSLRELITIPGGGTEHPATHETIDTDLHYVHMKGNEVYKHAVTRLFESAVKALELSGLTAGDIDMVIPHQANTRILQSVAKRLKIDYDSRFYINLDHIGNTSSASIPIALDEARNLGRITPGTTVLFVAFGGGLTWGGAVVRF
ncbi:ketoacyl-ACP synthase III [bacterium]|nr:ketoacyl-ACP synthase III [candidate division CSSED10-310 bacterium]